VIFKARQLIHKCTHLSLGYKIKH